MKNVKSRSRTRLADEYLDESMPLLELDLTKICDKDLTNDWFSYRKLICLQFIHSEDDVWVLEPPEFSDNPTSHLVADQKELVKKIINFALRNISFTLRRGFLTSKILRHGTDYFTSRSEERRIADSSHPYKFISFCRVWTHEHWIQCKHANYYTTEDGYRIL
jgi:hypothetical protein